MTLLLSIIASFGLLIQMSYAATINVCPSGCDYSSVQNAVNAADTGDVVEVNSGVYNEVISISKSITLIGKSGATIRPGDSTPALINGDLKAAILVNSVDNVTVEGFKIDGTGGTLNYGIYFFNSDNSASVRNIIHDVKNDPDEYSGVGILFFSWLKPIGGEVIEGNILYNCGRMCIFVGGQKNSTTFHLSPDNIIKANSVSNAWMGPTNQTGHAAVEIIGAQNALIKSNDVYDNLHSTTTSHLVGYGISIVGSAAPASSILDNFIYNNVQGLTIYTYDTRIDYNSNIPAAPNVHYNQIYNNNLYGMRSDLNSIHMVNATHNWWGSSTGPYDADTNPEGTGNGVWGSSIFKPYYEDSSMEVLSGQKSIDPSNDTDDSLDDPINFSVDIYTKMADGSEIIGLYAIMHRDGKVADSGFSPATFNFTNKNVYSVEVQDYENYTFAYWMDDNSTNRARLISSDVELVAIYKMKSESQAQSGITVGTIDLNGNLLTGYYTALSQDGNIVSTGFTPLSFETIPGQSYTVQVQDYGDYIFDHWLDDGSFNRGKTFTANGSGIDFTAVMKSKHFESNDSVIFVNTVDMSDGAISGYYVTLWKNGKMILYGFSLAQFAVNNSEEYQVAVSDYGPYIFDRWDDGSTQRFYNVSTGTSAKINLTAIYKTR